MSLPSTAGVVLGLSSSRPHPTEKGGELLCLLLRLLLLLLLRLQLLL